MKNSYYVEFRIGEFWFSEKFTVKRDAKRNFRERSKMEHVSIVRFRQNGVLVSF